MTAHKPATPLPWAAQPIGVAGKNNDIPISSIEPNVTDATHAQDAAYIAHACNAYPRLVEALRQALDFIADRSDDLDEGEQHAVGSADALLRELGEGA